MRSLPLRAGNTAQDGGGNLALEVGLFVVRPGGGRPPLQLEFYPSLKNS